MIKYDIVLHVEHVSEPLGPLQTPFWVSKYENSPRGIKKNSYFLDFTTIKKNNCYLVSLVVTACDSIPERSHPVMKSDIGFSINFSINFPSIPSLFLMELMESINSIKKIDGNRFASDSFVNDF